MSKKSILYILCGLTVLLAAIVIVIWKGRLPEYESPKPKVLTIEELAVNAAHEFTRLRFKDFHEIVFLRDSVVDRTISKFRYDIYEYTTADGKPCLFKAQIREFVWENEKFRWMPDTIYVVE